MIFSAALSRALALVESSYSLVGAPEACALLGCSGAELEALAGSRGWARETDGARTFFRIPVRATHAEITVSPADLDRFNRYVLHLES